MIELRGELRWNDLAGGVWNLEVEPDSNQSAEVVALEAFEPGDRFTDGTRVIVRGELQAGGGDIFMTGPRMRVDQVELA